MLSKSPNDALTISRKKCCSNACVDLSIPTSISNFRDRLKGKLLRDCTPSIAFDQADETCVMKSVSNPEVMNECASRIAHMLVSINVSDDVALSLARELVADVARALSYEELDQIGLRWHRKFNELGFSPPIEELMMGRNRWLAGLIAPRLLPGSSLDHDSGDSYVASFIQQQRPDTLVHTQDAFDFRREIRDLPFALYDYEQKKMPYPDDFQFDNVILATVLHHCDEPEKMFDAVVAHLRSGGRLFLFENVFDRGADVEIGANVFFDWFFNKIFHRSGLPLPFSHFCRDEWKTFLEHKGFAMIETQEYLGHWPSIPLEHALYIATKK